MENTIWCYCGATYNDSAAENLLQLPSLSDLIFYAEDIAPKFHISENGREYTEYICESEDNAER